MCTTLSLSLSLSLSLFLSLCRAPRVRLLSLSLIPPSLHSAFCALSHLLSPFRPFSLAPSSPLSSSLPPSSLQPSLASSFHPPRSISLSPSLLVPLSFPPSLPFLLPSSLHSPAGSDPHPAAVPARADRARSAPRRRGGFGGRRGEGGLPPLYDTPTCTHPCQASRSSASSKPLPAPSLHSLYPSPTVA